MKRKTKARPPLRKKKPVSRHELATTSKPSFELVKRDKSGEFSLAPMTARDIVNQIKLIQDIMKAVMKQGVHYGLIPGCGDKPTLFKAGAEKLTTTFRLVPSYPEIKHVDFPGGHREFIIRSNLKTFDGTLVGEGVGSCSTLESKYKYRRADGQNTGRAAPPFFWKIRKADPAKALMLIGGPGHFVKKVRDRWMIMVETDEKVENTNLADVWNTVLKMAKKRALVDVTIQATSASDMFTQDVEDLEENLVTLELETDWKPKAQREMERNNVPQGTIEVPQGTKAATVEDTRFPAGADATVQEHPEEEGDLNYDDWQSVVCHVGSENYRGKKLGELAAADLAFLQRNIHLSRNSTARDKKLFDALKDSRQGRPTNKTATAATPSK